ncbi:MAG: PDZ domain-containing protein [Sandaracinaceae bacterium]|nr:PDZ domain-containing protein [Sandaracinaceae bacterium]
MNSLKRLWKPLLAAAALLGAFFLTFVWPGRNALDFDIDASPRAQASHHRENYDLTRLAVLHNVVIEVVDHYVDPTRIQPRKMLLSGLNAIQRSVAPIIVDYEEGANSLTVQVNNQRRQFRVDDVNAPWVLTPRFREIFAFLQENLQNEDIDLRDIEYAAINGMLHTLDPHTSLLTPDVYTDMRMNTRGEFGGLGILIGIREGQLTVIKPMPGTPAEQVGLLRQDHVVKIGEESTLNMPLQEAVNRLRGAPGSRVTLWIVRDGPRGWQQPRRFELTRAVIHIASVESRMLEGGIGYIKLKSFQGNTFDDMQRALEQLHRQSMNGLVLDLRDNPGGLLDQAVRIADAFLTSGTIVTTDSPDPAQRDEKDAEGPGTEPNYPMIVLLNGGSASASEIVAGALKNHDRALIVGQTSFGKGSVQVLYDFEDGSALKLTIAQYLTPGGVSIQGVGIMPDITIDPMTVDSEDMDLTADEAYLRESDLRASLEHAGTRDETHSSLTLRYYLPKDLRQRLREAESEDDEDNTREDEFLTRFSRELLTHAHRPGRREMLADADAVLTRTRATEMDRAVAELTRLGVDWSLGADAGASQVETVVSTNHPNNVATAGENLELRIRVTNRGTAPLYQLRATTKSDYRLFNGRELVFGKLMPGQSREWSTTLGICETHESTRTCTLPRDIPDRADGVRIQFAEGHDHAPPNAELRTVIHALPRPQFAYQLQVADNIRGNGDGQLSRGESATMYLHIKNVGTGRAFETQANLANLSGAGVLLRAGRFTFPALAPGEERSIAFTFEILPDFEGELAKLEVSVVDVDLREGISEKILVPVIAAGSAPTPRTGTVRLRPGAVVRERPAANAAAVSRVGRATDTAPSAPLPTQAGLPGFVRIDLGNGRPGWVAEGDVVTGQDARSGATSIVDDFSHVAPTLTVDYGNTLTTHDVALPLRGRAVDRARITDLYIFVGIRKVFYQSNRGAQNPAEATFQTRVPLHPGVNYVTVVARHDDAVMSRHTFVVRRDGPDGALLDTPRYDEDELGADHFDPGMIDED